MFKSATNQGEVALSKLLDRVAHHTLGTLAVLHKIKFHLSVLVNGVGEAHLVAVDEVEAILHLQRCDFGNNTAHNSE